MISTRYKNIIKCFLLLSAFLFITPSNSYASLVGNELKYKIVENQSNYYNKNKTSVTIDTTERIITLSKDSYIPADALQFVGKEGNDEDFVVLTKTGLKYYSFNGSGWENINQLNVNITNPYGVALNYNGDFPSYFISQIQPDGSGKIKHFMFDGSTGMVENTSMTITDTSVITSLATFTEFNDGDSVGFTTKDAFKFYANVDGTSYAKVSEVSGLNTPLSLAAGSNGLSFAILNKDKVERYSFDGNNFSSIPPLEIALSNEKGKPRAVVLDDIEETTYVLTDQEMMAYSFDGGQMFQNTSLSISKSKLKKPQAMTFNPSNNGLMIIDKEDNGNYKGKYFLRGDNGEYIENSYLNLNYFDEIVKTVSATFTPEGTIHFGTFNLANDMNLIRIRAYTQTPKNTKIVFQVSNTKDAGGNPIWVDSWVVENKTSQYSHKGNITKFLKTNSGIIQLAFGNNDKAYPTYQNMDNNYQGTDGYHIENSTLNVIPPLDYTNSLWTKMPAKGKNIDVRAVLYTSDPLVAPRIFAPIGSNNDMNITNTDETAIHIEVNAQPTKPNITDIGTPPSNPGQIPGSEELKFSQMPNWIYTTTPKLEWQYIDENGNNQDAYQVLILGKKDGGWQIIHNSGYKGGSASDYTIPFNDRIFYNANTYEFGVAVRVWDDLGGVSDFSDTRTFKVLAYENPRIVNIINPVEGQDLVMPEFLESSSHFKIGKNFRKNDLLKAKAGAQVSLALDSVGPIISFPDTNAKFIAIVGGNEVGLNMSDNSYMNPLGVLSKRNTWVFNFFTDAPISKIPDNTLIKARFVGECDPLENGGNTIFYMPNWADGVIVTGGTIYTDWQVVIQGRDR